MLRVALIAAVAVMLGAATVTAAEARTPATRVAPAPSVTRPAPVFTAFRSHFGLGSRSHFGFGSRRRYGYGYGYGRRSHGLLHRVVRTAIWLYVLHLFFTHGGLSILLWVIVLGLVFSLLRRRRRRYAYRSQSPWP